MTPSLHTMTAYLAGYVDGVAGINTYGNGHEQAWSNFNMLPQATTIGKALAGLDIESNCHMLLHHCRSVDAVQHSSSPREFVEGIFGYWLFDRPDGPQHLESTRKFVLDEIWSSLEMMANFKRLYEVRERRYPSSMWPKGISDEKRDAFFLGGTFVLEADEVRIIFCFNIMD